MNTPALTEILERSRKIKRGEYPIDCKRVIMLDELKLGPAYYLKGEYGGLTSEQAKTIIKSAKGQLIDGGYADVAEIKRLGKSGLRSYRPWHGGIQIFSRT